MLPTRNLLRLISIDKYKVTKGFNSRHNVLRLHKYLINTVPKERDILNHIDLRKNKDLYNSILFAFSLTSPI